MILISHRGNIEGKNEKYENHPERINFIINSGFDVEIDVRSIGEKIFLGHDKPDYEVDKEFLLNEKLWCHAKDLGALNFLKKINAHYFWHDNDSYTLTSMGYFWTYPGKKLSKNSICVLPELNNQKFENCAGVCSDFISQYK